MVCSPVGKSSEYSSLVTSSSGRPTPCREFAVRSWASYLTSLNLTFILGLGGRPLPPYRGWWSMTEIQHKAPTQCLQALELWSLSYAGCGRNNSPEFRSEVELCPLNPDYLSCDEDQMKQSKQAGRKPGRESRVTANS